MQNYQEGRAAFHRGIACQNPPHDDASRRIPWLKGWFDSRDEHLAGSAPVAALRR